MTDEATYQHDKMMNELEKRESLTAQAESILDFEFIEIEAQDLIEDNLDSHLLDLLEEYHENKGFNSKIESKLKNIFEAWYNVSKRQALEELATRIS